jgi:hypothetical protein
VVSDETFTKVVKDQQRRQRAWYDTHGLGLERLTIFCNYFSPATDLPKWLMEPIV